jgi:predicted secreted Zn-dependent protease
VPEWPDMTAADKAAVKNYRDALKAHEDGHHKVAKDWAGKETKKITGEGATPEEARADLERKLEEYKQDAQSRLDQAGQDYDAKTASGANQKAVGGKNVELNCP